MAELVGVYAASHAPLIIRAWNAIPAGQQIRLNAAYGELGRRIDAVRPDVIVGVTPDHWVNFFIDNLPAICLGMGAQHRGTSEPWMSAFPRKTLPGHPRFAQHLAETALDSDFEPSLSYDIELDHGFCIPIWRMELAHLPAIVPMIINGLEPPMPSIRRCAAWGRLLAQAIRTYPGDLRVAVLATGGISHSIGEPTMGEIDEPFDRDCIRYFTSGDEGPLVEFLDARLNSTGNGAHEVRNWVVAHATAGSRGFELIDYLNVPEVYVGCGYAAWNLA